MMSAVPYTLQSYSEIAAKQSRGTKDITLKDPGVANVVGRLRGVREKERLRKTKGFSNEKSDGEVLESFLKARDELMAERDAAVDAANESALSRLNLEILPLLEKSLLRGTEVPDDSVHFEWGLTPGAVVYGRRTYRISGDYYRAITSKQIEKSIDSITQRWGESRQRIVSAFKDSLNRPFGFGVLRLDIANFFDSIPHSTLKSVVYSNDRIDSVTKVLVNQLLAEYRTISNSTVGVPQGVGISSKLAELYLTSLDSSISSHPAVSYYARYVDDFVIVTKEKEDLPKVESEVKALLRSLGLRLNAEKSQKIIADPKGNFTGGQSKIEFLGYEFRKTKDNPVCVLLTERKLAKLSYRLEKAFEIWDAQRLRLTSDQRDSADGLLANRIRFLTSNGPLLNSKSHVWIGIYFSNQELTDFSQLEHLDEHLKSLIQKHGQNMNLRLMNRLTRYSFEKGFHEKTLYRPSLNHLERISACWSDSK